MAFIAIASDRAASHALDKFVNDKVQTLAQYLHNKCELFTKDMMYPLDLKKAFSEAEHYSVNKSLINRRLW